MMIAALLLSLSLYAAPAAQSTTPFSIGGYLGLNFSDANTTPSISTSTRTGFILGTNLEIKSTDIFFIQPELRYIQKGFEVEGGTATFTYKFNYIEVPILAKIKFMTASNVKPYLLAGPGIALNVSAGRDRATATTSTSSELGEFITDFDFSLIFGGGAEFITSDNIGFFADLRYGLGLSDIDDTNSEINNRGLEIIAGAKLAL